MNVKLKKYSSKYLEEILSLFNHTIESVNMKDYTQAEINQWVQYHPNLDKWNQRFENSYCIVAFCDKELVGFGNIQNNGYLDCLYVSKEYIRKGIGELLFCELEKYAKSRQNKKISTDASITAVHFFSKMGFNVIQKQNNERNGQNLINYRMTKEIKERF